MAQPIRIGIIGGTGLSAALAGEGGDSIDVDTPFGPPSSPVRHTRWHEIDVFILQRHGPGHVFNPSHVPYRANVFALKTLGVTHLLTSGATGSLREDIAPGDLVIVDQLIDKTHGRSKSFFEHGAVHIELAEPYCPLMRQWLLHAAERLQGVRVHRAGTYVCMEGPAFSTRAESQMHRQWGGDLIGMTAQPEARLAREAEIACALVGLPTDYDCWRPLPEGVSHAELLPEIIGNLEHASRAGVELMRAALADLAPLREQRSPAHDALKLAIWTDKSKFDPETVERLRPLWGRYFENADA